MSDNKSVDISDEAVEAAMIAQYESERGRDEWVPFSDLPDEFLDRYRASAKLILEAAAPHMRAGFHQVTRDLMSLPDGAVIRDAAGTVLEACRELAKEQGWGARIFFAPGSELPYGVEDIEQPVIFLSPNPYGSQR